MQHPLSNASADDKTASAGAPAGMPPRRWDGLRRRVVGGFFARLFGGVGRALCEPGQLPARGIHRVLICRPNHRLGNALLISPLLAEVEALYPGAEIDIISAGHAAGSLFGNRFLVRRIFSLPPKIARHLWFTIALLRQLRGNTYDLAIDACDGSQSGRLLLAMVRARYKLGLPDAQQNPGSAWHALRGPEHFAQRGVFLLRTAYAGTLDGAYPPLTLRLADDEREQARRALAAILGEPAVSSTPRRPVLGLFTNATGAKRFDTSWWQQFVARLRVLQPELQIVDLVADHGQSQLGGEFAAYCMPSYYTRDLRRLAAMIANMDAFISADCGVMHLAVASGTPTLGLFSVTSAAKYGPYGSANSAIDTRRLSPAEVASIASDWLSVP